MKIPLLKNTITNYLVTALKIAEGFLLVRWIVGLLGVELYGLWGLLWSLLMYAALVDFGFGLTVRKYTARALWQSDLAHYNRIVSTVGTLSVLMTLPMLLATALAIWQAPFLFKLQNADPSLVRLSRFALLIFGVGNAVNFPLTLFGNIIVGLHRQYIQNAVYAALKVVELLAVCLVFLVRLPPYTAFYVLLAVVIVIPILGNLGVGVAVCRLIPGLRLCGGFSRAAFKEVFSFSGWLYLGTLARLLLNTISPLVVGSMCGLTVSGVFQIGRKFPQIMSQLTVPYQDNTSPLAARLWARGRRRTLGSVLLGFMRWNAFLSTALSVPVFALAPELIRFFFRVDNAEAVAVCRLFTVHTWLSLVASTVPQAAFIMIDRHKFHICTQTLSAVLTMALTVGALRLWPDSAVAVTAAGFVAAAALAFLAHFPMLSRVTGLPLGELFRRSVGIAFLAAVPAVGAARSVADWVGGGDFLRLAAGSAVGLSLFLPLGGFLLFTSAELGRFKRRVRERFS